MCALLILAAAVLLPSRPAAAIEQLTSTGGALYVSSSANFQWLERAWDSPDGYRILRANFKRQGRPQFQGASYSYDYGYLYFRTRGSCPTCWSYWGTWYWDLTHDLWVDFAAAGYDVVALRVALYTNYSSAGGTAWADVPQVVRDVPPFTPGKPSLPYDNSVPYNQQRITWSTNNNPPGTTYELWRRTFDAAGNQIADLRIYSGASAAFTTTDQVAGRFYRFRVRAVHGGNTSPFSPETAYWTASVPSVTPGVQSLTLSWPAVFPGVTYRVWWRQEGGSWSNATTSSTSYTITGLNPALRYNAATSPVLPEGGTDWWQGDAAGLFSPLYPAVNDVAQGNTTQTSAEIWWAYGQTGARIRVQRNGQTVWEGTPSYSYQCRFNRCDNWALYNDTGLQPGTSYTYTVCAANAMGQCGPVQTLAVTTVPATPAAPAAQHGSYEWRTTSAGGAWTELAWQPVQGATGYRIYLSGAENRTIDAGNRTRYTITDLRSAAAYTVQVAAYNGSGESPRFGGTSFSTPDRADAVPPQGTVLINEGAAQTSGARVHLRVQVRDDKSGPVAVQFSNNGQNWSQPLPLQDQTAVNLVAVAGGDAFLTSLGGWRLRLEDTGRIWTDVIDSAEAQQGGRVARIRWDGTTADRWLGLALARSLPAEAGRAYTLSIRFKVENLTAGTVAVWSHWLDANGNSLPANATADIVLGRSELSGRGWQVATVSATAPPGTAQRSLILGFDQANTGALLYADWVQINEGATAAPPTNVVPAADRTHDWELDVSSGAGRKTVYARFQDVAGNWSQSVTASIEYRPTDIVAPRLSARVNDGATATDRREVRVQIEARDDQTPQSMLRVRLSSDGQQWSPWAPYQPEVTWTLTAGEGRKRVWVQAQDAAGNVGEAIAEVFYRTSLAPVEDRAVFWPTVGNQGTFNLGGPSVTVQYVRVRDVTVAWDLSRLSGIRTVRYSFDQNMLGVAGESLTSGRTIGLPAGDGIQTLHAQLDDGRVYIIRFLVDTLPPQVRAAWQGGATVTAPGGAAAIVLVAQDNLARTEDLEVSVNGGAWAPYQASIPVTLTGSGPRTVTVQVRDPAGNSSSAVLDIYVLP